MRRVGRAESEAGFFESDRSLTWLADVHFVTAPNEALPSLSATRRRRAAVSTWLVAKWYPETVQIEVRSAAPDLSPEYRRISGGRVCMAVTVKQLLDFERKL